MQTASLKLKQASAVLGMPPKELQNFVQFGVVKPRRREGVYWFDENVLLQAKIGWYLRESLGVSISYLARLVQLTCRAASSGERQRQFIWLRSRPSSSSAAIEIRIPVRSLAEEIEERLPLAKVYRDLPRGRKRSGWKAEFLETLGEAAVDLGDLSEEDILQAVKKQRKATRSKPEITVASEATITGA
jgi:DNA-binding transcriptional MerR regulator